MKKIVIILWIILFMSEVVIASDFLHPMDFKGSETEKQQVIEYIKKTVKKKYTSIGMGDPSTLRMMEREELNSFKKLTIAKNRKLLDAVIKQFCKIGMCDYSTISMMYDDQLESFNKKLTW